MSHRLSTVLAFAIAALLGLSTALPADAATRKKAKRPAASQVRSAAPKAPASQDRAAQLNRLYEQYWDASMRLNPLKATFQGDGRHNGELPNFLSAAFRQQSHDFTVEWLGKVEAIGPQGLTGQDLLSYELFVRDARLALEAEKFPSWMMPISQYSNVASIMAVLGSGAGPQPFATVKDYENWSRRSVGIPALFDQAIANMRQGIAAGVVQPRVVMEKVLPQLDAVIRPTAEESLFWMPIRNMPEDFSEEDRTRLTAEYKRMIENRIMPAYRSLRGFIATVYLPAARNGDGLSTLPNGQAWYAHHLRQATSTTQAPAELHAAAVAQVEELQARIVAEMKQARLRGSPEKLLRNMRNDRQFRSSSAEALLADYRQVHDKVRAGLPTLIGTLPGAPLQVQAMDAARAATAPAISYQQPLSDGAPGVLYVNTSDLAARKRWAVPMQFVHEALPGHHVQLGLQQGLDRLPRFRHLGGDVAFVEGWGLYAESLGLELGVYDDPHARIAYLQAALSRAARMAADTGLHAQGWSRKQAVDYLVRVGGLEPATAEADVERSLAEPGQALANRAGELKFLELRAAAEQALGGRFDVRAFHDEVLRDGSLPLDILQAKIERWIASQSRP
jgi:uncharacterized protein (DUF885 family)